MIAPKMVPVAGGMDFQLVDGKIPTSSDGQQAAEHAWQKLYTYKGENTLDGQLSNLDNDGTRWYEVLFRTDKSRAEKDLEIKRRILTTPGVKKIKRPLVWTQTGHNVEITGSVISDWGEEIDLDNTVGISG